MYVPPHLPEITQRLDFLESKGYFGGSPLTDSQAHHLSQINFHFFLGYARNYAMLHDRGIFIGPRDPQHVFDIMRLDQEVATCLFNWIRQAELWLRNQTVHHFCSNGTPTSYLDESRLRAESLDADQRSLVERMLREIFRYSEDYVVRSLHRKAEELKVEKPKEYSPQSHDLCLSLAGDLPLWSVVDCFSLGQLGKFIMACDGDIEDPTQRTWRRLADDLGMRTAVFHRGVNSLAITRNLVCHHMRLWMRPATNSPKKPKKFDKDLRGIDPNSQLMAFANVAHFQQGSNQRQALNDIFQLAKTNTMYFYGISQTSHKDKARGR